MRTNNFGVEQRVFRRSWAVGVVLAAGALSVSAASCVGDPIDAPSSPDSDASGGDGGLDSASPVDAQASDAGTDAAPLACDPTKAFGAPTALHGFDTSADEGEPRLSPDELTMYFWGNGGALTDASTSSDIFVASRTSVGDNFGAPVRLAISTNQQEYDPTVSSDGKTLLWHVFLVSSTQIMKATRTSTSSDFGGATALVGLQEDAGIFDQNPFLSADSSQLWFASSRARFAGVADVFVATSSGAGDFTNPTAVPSLNFDPDAATVSTYAPVLSADSLTIYVTSNRPGTQGGVDIWYSHRLSATAAFPAPSNVTEVNTASDDVPGWLSPDNCRLYLTSTKNGNDDIFVATRTP